MLPQHPANDKSASSTSQCFPSSYMSFCSAPFQSQPVLLFINLKTMSKIFKYPPTPAIMTSLIILLSLISPALAIPSHTSSITPAPFSPTACIIGGNPCPTGSACTQTQTCGGLCIPSPTPIIFPPCTVGQPGCAAGAICTPTMVCPTAGPCGGACITTAVNTTPAPLPTKPCVLGANDCPSGSLCTQTQVCEGLCIATGTSAASPVRCLVGYGGAGGCLRGSTCTPTRTCGGYGFCGGVCVDVGPTTTAFTACGGRHEPPYCKEGFRCREHVCVERDWWV